MADKLPVRALELDLAFLKSRRGLLKISEMVVLFVAFVCFAVAARPPYIAATCVEFIVTLALVLLYLLKLNKTITFFFWPLIDVFNSVFAATFILIISIMALSTYTVQGTLAGGIASLVAVVLWFVDGFHLFKKITFNQPRGAT
ncbi:chemokine-like factor [Pygocentrus nattereri]|uniref:MARVEL domain-containing protein n=1 Tax=Pygocentrus nattereri TaxID=42514 RepID=A0AAR2KHD6_PYGNA|nr:chemokine-like factor [Pygocentrus nattereri]